MGFLNSLLKRSKKLNITAPLPERRKGIMGRMYQSFREEPKDSDRTTYEHPESPQPPTSGSTSSATDTDSDSDFESGRRTPQIRWRYTEVRRKRPFFNSSDSDSGSLSDWGCQPHREKRRAVRQRKPNTTYKRQRINKTYGDYQRRKRNQLPVNKDSRSSDYDDFFSSDDEPDMGDQTNKGSFKNSLPPPLKENNVMHVRAAHEEQQNLKKRKEDSCNFYQSHRQHNGFLGSQAKPLRRPLKLQTLQKNVRAAHEEQQSAKKDHDNFDQNQGHYHGFIGSQAKPLRRPLKLHSLQKIAFQYEIEHCEECKRLAFLDARQQLDLEKNSHSMDEAGTKQGTIRKNDFAKSGEPVSVGKAQWIIGISKELENTTKKNDVIVVKDKNQIEGSFEEKERLLLEKRAELTARLNGCMSQLMDVTMEEQALTKKLKKNRGLLKRAILHLKKQK